MRRWAIVTCFIAWLFVPISQAQEWQNLASLRPGTKVNVVDRHLRTQSGKFVRFSDTNLTLQSAGQEVVFSRDQVYRVTVGGGRKRHTLIGMAIGGAIGLGIGVATVVAYHGDIEAAAAVATTAFGAGVGAGIGAITPPHTTTIYRTEPVKEAGLTRAH